MEIGLSPACGLRLANTIIMLLPFMLAVDVDVDMIFMVSLLCASQMGGGITSILLNIPGNGGSAATCLDGYPMAKKGQGQQALVLSFVASTVGGMVTAGMSIFLLPYMARLAYYLHSGGSHWDHAIGWQDQLRRPSRADRTTACGARWHMRRSIGVACLHAPSVALHWDGAGKRHLSLCRHNCFSDGPRISYL
ncbi:tripartite tricarboxylate transporter permease [Terrihabitans rhizophilus]|uniref:Tripartite tricarboxylate transporter permease n=1 Tax=Terrihabitans rhizophilus TaxID=3092662 RepID=A0ABU4RUU1_9HYPH|nr:tripartite tricarboxylate transporter permease [Terrihabitans sp. PJ23]MDX6807415.1 tripartite tricarboxylate transporter permease [Terrihabitans sp. PJ23]